MDMDGVLYRLSEPIEHARDFMKFARNAGLKVLFITNNSYYKRDEYVKRLKSMAIDSEKREIITSGLISAAYIESEFGAESKVLYIGGAGIKEELSSKGIRTVSLRDWRNADVVLCGWDLNIDFEKLKAATLAINAGAHFIATNNDATFPAPEGLWPGAGAIVAAIAKATSKSPLVLGKPEKYMIDYALSAVESAPQRAAIIGDRPETDINAAENAHTKSILVLTGVLSCEDLMSGLNRLDCRPDLVVEDLGKLMNGDYIDIDSI